MLNGIRILFIITLMSCHEPPHTPTKINDDLVVEQISPHVYIHHSYLETDSFGLVECNGMVISKGGKAIIVDTPTNEKSAKKLYDWIVEELNAEIIAVLPTHFHEDCLGGLEFYHEQGIPSYATSKTLKLAKSNQVTVPQNGFKSQMELSLDGSKVNCFYPGEGHTRDNMVVYFAQDSVLFGGCLIKSDGSNKGYLGDANVADWSQSVIKVKENFPDTKIVIPGHGQHGSTGLLDYTIQLFKE